MTSEEGSFPGDDIAAPVVPVGSSVHLDADIVLLSELLRGERITADAPALADGTDELTYGAYALLVGQVASAVAALGVGPGDRVGVHLRKSVFSFVAVHGVIRAGAVMVPLDPMAPVDHLVSMIDDADIGVLISDGRVSVLTELAAVGVRAMIVRANDTVVEQLDEIDGLAVVDWNTIAERAPIDPVQANEDDPAYIIYTSGSTGRPKGIVHSHRSALAYARLAADMYHLTPDDRLANVASLHFDQSTFELYAAPLVGCAVTVVPDAVLRFPASVSELIERHRVTVWYSVPYILRQLTSRGALDERDLSALRWVLYGGESYPPDELSSLMAFLPNASVSNVYGPAEVNQCTCFNLTEPPEGLDAIPIGVPWSETELAVLPVEADDDADDDDDDDEVDVATVPDGEAGELIVATTTMMSGYWNRPDLTAAAIVERTIPGATATRWYRTGDLVRWIDGNLVFLGRADNQVKLRGQRVELEAIDLTIRALDTVAEVAVVVETLDDGEQRLVAVIEPVGAGPSLKDVQTVVAARHPRVAVPADMVTVVTLARTGTDKVDRNAVLEEILALRVR